MSKHKEKEEPRRKRNIAIYSLNGGIFTVDKGIQSDDGISEEEILKEIFKGKDIDEISFTKITNSSFKDIANMPEDIRIYFSSSTDQVWNYNPIISVYMGSLIYSSIIVFVSEKELEDFYPDDPDEIMPNDMFLSIVGKFINVCTEFAYKSMEESTSKSKKETIDFDEDDIEENKKKSPMFQLAKIAYKTCIGQKDICVKAKRDMSGLDEHWSKNYVGKYSPDFVISDMLAIDDETGQYSSCYLMMKPGLMTLYLLSAGKADIYFTQTPLSTFRSILEKIDDKIDDLGKDPSEEDIKKAKEKILLKILYN